MHGDDERLGQLPAVDLPRVDAALGYMRDVALDVAGHAGQIQAGGEHGPFAVQDARAQCVVGVEFAVGGGEFTQHGGVERVAFVRAVQADDLHVAVTADLQGFVGHGFSSLSGCAPEPNSVGGVSLSFESGDRGQDQRAGVAMIGVALLYAGDHVAGVRAVVDLVDEVANVVPGAGHGRGDVVR